MYLPKAAFSQRGLWGTLGVEKKHLKNYAEVPRDKKLHVRFREDKIVEKRWPEAINSAVIQFTFCKSFSVCLKLKKK
ncbi:hypothetical protein D917_07711 [Trichinella nativa]|uniref:Uncharacterized protein n=1 Tax=Trichinella nativa TaxID=6335 RepID=A0A1Y3EMT6_9BILA|nr:hypothetical protein D917_07711 [Trichinella nativa]